MTLLSPRVGSLRRKIRSAGVAASFGLVLVPALLGSDCDGSNPTYPERQFVVELHAPGSLGDPARSQLGRPHPDYTSSSISPLPGSPTPVLWPGDSDQVNIQMSAPSALNVLLLDPSGAPSADSCLFLDGLGGLADRGLRAQPGSGEITKQVLAHEYAAILAPNCLLGQQPLGHIDTLSIQGKGLPAGEPLELQAPEQALVPGRVETTAGVPIEGAVLTLFGSTHPEDFLGVSLTTEADGSFDLTVPAAPPECGTKGEPPCPTYDVLISAPGDGSLGLPPIRLRNVVLPLGDNFSLLVRYPQLALTTLRGTVVLEEEPQTPFVTRLRIEGDIPSVPGVGHQFEGGLYRVEVSTDAEGRFELEVPAGQYTITAWPEYDKAHQFDVGRLELEVDPGLPLIDNLIVSIPDADFARIEVRDEDGSPVLGAQITLRMREAPHYRFAEVTTAGLNGWAGQLMRGTYDVEVVPPLATDLETNELNKTHSRIHGLLDHSSESSILQLFLRRSDPFEGFIYGPADSSPGASIEGRPGIRVLMLDPQTGEVLDETITARENGAGFFRGLLPRQ